MISVVYYPVREFLFIWCYMKTKENNDSTQFSPLLPVDDIDFEDLSEIENSEIIRALRQTIKALWEEERGDDVRT